MQKKNQRNNKKIKPKLLKWLNVIGMGTGSDRKLIVLQLVPLDFRRFLQFNSTNKSMD